MDNPREENTYVLDPESAAEMARLLSLDHLATRGMGGPLAGLPDLPTHAQILDIACGPGSWVLDVAFAYPDSEVAGIDISQIMIRYAQASASSQGRTNASFGLMDMTKPLDFSDDAFDLVNARFLTAVLLREAWPHVLKEFLRITRPGGILRLTEFDLFGYTTSPAYEQLMTVISLAMHRAGYGFSPDGKTTGMSPVLGRLLENAGCQQIHYQAHVINFSAGTEAWIDFYDNIAVGSQLLRPFLVKMGTITDEELHALYAQVLAEMQVDDFCGAWYFVSAWGRKIS